MKKKNIEFVKPGGLELKDRLVSIQRVTKVTKGGRAFGFSAIVVVGNEDGIVGHGLSATDTVKATWNNDFGSFYPVKSIVDSKTFTRLQAGAANDS